MSAPTPTPSDRPRTLHRIGWAGKNTGHWALFLPDQEGSQKGLLVEVGVAQKGGTKLGSTDSQSAQLDWRQFQVTRSTAQRVVAINHAKVTTTQLLTAAKQVFNEKPYHPLTNNCQHTCVGTVKRLNKLYPAACPQAAIDELKAHDTAFTKYI